MERVKGIEGNILVINQIQDLLVKVSDEMYVMPLDIFSGATLGKQIRHVYDYYETLCKCLYVDTIDYKDRRRDPLIELSCMHAIECFSDLSKKVLSLNEQQRLKIVLPFDSKDNEKECVDSNVARELMFVFDHAIHHLEMIRMALKVNFPMFSVPFGVGLEPTKNIFKNIE